MVLKGPMSTPKKKLPSILENKPFESPLPTPKPTPTGPRSTPVTPTVVKQRQSDAQNFIQTREKALAQGATKEQAVAIATGKTANQEFTPQISVNEAKIREAKRNEVLANAGLNPDGTPLTQTNFAQVQNQTGDVNQTNAIDQTTGKPFLQPLSNTLGLPAQKGFQEAGAAFASGTAETAATIIDAITGTFTARKSAKVTSAEAALTDSMKAIETDIQLVAAGVKSGSEARLGFNKAREAVGRLSSSQKGLGKVNLRYWLGGGKEIETEIILTNQRLDDLEKTLNLAILKATNDQFGIVQ